MRQTTVTVMVDGVIAARHSFSEREESVLDGGRQILCKLELRSAAAAISSALVAGLGTSETLAMCQETMELATRRQTPQSAAIGRLAARVILWALDGDWPSLGLLVDRAAQLPRDGVFEFAPWQITLLDEYASTIPGAVAGDLHAHVAKRLRPYIETMRC